MNVLGISGSDRHAAAAVSVDGTIVAAAAEESFARVPAIGYSPWGRYPLAAIESCLARAAIAPSDLDRVVVVEDRRSRTIDEEPEQHAGTHSFDGADRTRIEREVRGRAHAFVAPAVADARQIAAACDDGAPMVVLVLSPESGEAATFERRDGNLTPLPDTAGGSQLLCAIARMTQALGLGRGEYAEVERLAARAGDADQNAFHRAITWDPRTGVAIDPGEFARAIQPLGELTEPAAGESDVNAALQLARQELAAGFCRRMNTLVAAIVDRSIEQYGEGCVGLAGSLIGSHGIAAAARSAARGTAILAPVPEPSGRAMGAALDGSQTSAAAIDSLALGPEFSEPEIKLALENCRLDYLYEPDWPRLLARISKMLSRGTVVAWFQGPMGFGPRSIGTRSILCDPSNHYARENINRFLRHGRLDEPLPVAMTAEASRESLDDIAGSPFLTLDAEVKPPWRDTLRAAIDGRGRIPVQLVTETQAPALAELLQIHRARSGVPGLINTTLAGAHEPCACTPRDAIRTTFSSAIDAMVIGRFLLMKDYWLLRSGTDK